MRIKASFDPKIDWVVTECNDPIKRKDNPEGTEQSTLAYEARKLWRFITGADNRTAQFKKEQMFIQMLECL